MRLLHARAQAFRFSPKAHARLQFVVRTLAPAGDRAFSHVVREEAALAGLRRGGKRHGSIDASCWPHYRSYLQYALDLSIRDASQNPAVPLVTRSTMRFDVAGPFLLSRHGFKGLITEESLKDLKEAAEAWETGLSSACGCYVFAMRAGKGYTPYYVGQSSKKAIIAEALNTINQMIYNKVLGSVSKGKPVIYLIPMKTPGGRFRKPNKSESKKRTFPSVDFLEEWLIAQALQKNPSLRNNMKTKFVRQLHVVGLFNPQPGEATKASTELKKAIWKP
jgi:hypothetical protein